MAKKTRHNCCWFDQDEGAFTFKTGLRSYIYRVYPDQVRTTAELLHMVRHIERKTWSRADHIERFIGAWCHRHRRRRWDMDRLIWWLPEIK